MSQHNKRQLASEMSSGIRKRVGVMTKYFFDRQLANAVLACLLAAPATAADEPAKPKMHGPGFWKTSQLYDLCISQYQTDRAHCEGFITGVASTLLDEQLSHIRVCIPKHTSSDDVVKKVVWYLREKADADDMKLAAANFVGPLLATLYNCTPGQPPKIDNRTN